jgi:hypothetical protein
MEHLSLSPQTLAAQALDETEVEQALTAARDQLRVTIQ